MSAQRQPLIPDVISLEEGVALKGFYQDIWTGFFVKKGTPEPVMKHINTALNAVMADPKMIAMLESQNQVVNKAQTLAEAEKIYALGTKQFRGIAKAIGLKPQ